MEELTAVVSIIQGWVSLTPFLYLSGPVSLLYTIFRERLYEANSCIHFALIPSVKVPNEKMHIIFFLNFIDHFDI